MFCGNSRDFPSAHGQVDNEFSIFGWTYPLNQLLLTNKKWNNYIKQWRTYTNLVLLKTNPKSHHAPVFTKLWRYNSCLQLRVSKTKKMNGCCLVAHIHRDEVQQQKYLSNKSLTIEFLLKLLYPPQQNQNQTEKQCSWKSGIQDQSINPSLRREVVLGRLMLSRAEKDEKSMWH